MRTGHLSLRGQPLNLPLLDVFKKDEITLRISCGPQPITTAEFTEIQTEVTNHLGKSLLSRSSCAIRVGGLTKQNEPLG